MTANFFVPHLAHADPETHYYKSLQRTETTEGKVGMNSHTRSGDSHALKLLLRDMDMFIAPYTHYEFGLDRACVPVLVGVEGSL